MVDVCLLTLREYLGLSPGSLLEFMLHIIFVICVVWFICRPTVSNVACITGLQILGCSFGFLLAFIYC